MSGNICPHLEELLGKSPGGDCLCRAWDVGTVELQSKHFVILRLLCKKNKQVELEVWLKQLCLCLSNTNPQVQIPSQKKKYPNNKSKQFEFQNFIFLNIY
jgi:hypothetical protein